MKEARQTTGEDIKTTSITSSHHSNQIPAELHSVISQRQDFFSMQLVKLASLVSCLLYSVGALALPADPTPASVSDNPGSHSEMLGRMLRDRGTQPQDSGAGKKTARSSSSRKRGEKSSPSLDKMFAELPAGIAELFKKAYSTPGLKGDVLYTARRHCEIKFTMDNFRHLKPADVLMAQVHLYHIRPRKPLPIRSSRSDSQQVRHARVSVHQVTKKGKKFHAVTKVLDSRLLSVDESGWVSFDITSAVKNWIRRPSTNLGLEVWVESTEAGKQAVRVARKTRVVKPDASTKQLRPALVMYFKTPEANVDNVTNR